MECRGTATPVLDGLMFGGRIALIQHDLFIYYHFTIEASVRERAKVEKRWRMLTNVDQYGRKPTIMVASAAHSRAYMWRSLIPCFVRTGVGKVVERWMQGQPMDWVATKGSSRLLLLIQLQFNIYMSGCVCGWIWKCISDCFTILDDVAFIAAATRFPACSPKDYNVVPFGCPN